MKGGRCEVCRGDGQIKIEMHFLPDVYVPCEQCDGKRYNRETLEVRFKGRTIADVLDMTVEEALGFFTHIPKIRRRLQALHDVGLDYIRLGQPATTLSGGEAQRVKLASELSKVATGRTLYILDEPTTGLHFADVERLLEMLDRLVEQGNTVVVIEHNLDVIKTADRLIDLGPEGGEEGGRLVAQGTPEQVAANEGSHTGQLPERDRGARQAQAAAREGRGRGLTWQLAPVGTTKLWAQKWLWYERNSLPWNRARIHREFARREAFARWPLHGNVLEAFREGRLEVGEQVLLEPHVWLTAPERGADPDRRGQLPQHRRDGGRGRPRGDRRALHVRQRLLRHRRQPPLRRSGQAGALAGLQQQGAHARGRQRLVRRQRGGGQRRDDRRALRDRRQQRGDRGHPRVLDRGRGARPGDPEGGVRAGPGTVQDDPRSSSSSAGDDQVERPVAGGGAAGPVGPHRPRRSRSRPATRW